jgi:hypothetical protein
MKIAYIWVGRDGMGLRAFVHVLILRRARDWIILRRDATGRLCMRDVRALVLLCIYVDVECTL